MTRICIFGAGAIGGFVGARLTRTGEADISLVARGAHLEAMKAHGLKFTEAGENYVVHPRVTADPRELGPQDFILLTLKSHALPGVAALLGVVIELAQMTGIATPALKLVYDLVRFRAA